MRGALADVVGGPGAPSPCRRDSLAGIYPMGYRAPMLALRFHRTARGSSPVEDHIESFGVAERTHVLAALADIQEAGIAGSGVTTRQIEGKLWEIKVSAQRVFYVVVTGPTMVLLHAYKK